MIKFTHVRIIKAFGIMAFGAFAMLGLFSELERRVDRHLRDVESWQRYDRIAPVNEPRVGGMLIMQSDAIRYRKVRIGFVDVLECELDKYPDTLWESVAVYPVRLKEPAIIGRPRFPVPPGFPRISGRFQWEGKLPPSPATCRYVGNLQIVAPSGVFKDGKIESEPFRVEAADL